MSGNILIAGTIVLSFFNLVIGDLAELKIKEVILSHKICRQTLKVGRGETIRLLPSSGPACDGEMKRFDCKVTFQRSYWSSDDELCVDFSRIQPTGDSSLLVLDHHPLLKNPSIELTNMHFPLKEYMLSTVKCSKAYAPITLHFKSACNASVSDFFPSWLYIYVQRENDKLYYLDGTCKHVYWLEYRSELRSVTVRSILWRNTLGEPNVQRCSLKVELLTLRLGEKNSFVCPSWNFTSGRPPCSTTVQWQKMLLLNDTLSDDIAASCDRSLNNSDITRCFEDTYGVMVQVNRNRQVEETGWIQNPGQQLLSMTAQYNHKTTVFKSTIDSYETSWNNDRENTNPFTSASAAGEMTPIAKVFLGMAAFAGVICCLCSVAQKMSKKHAREDESQASRQQRQRFMEGSAASVQQTGRFVPRRDPYTYEENLAMQQVPHRPRHLHNIVRVQVRRDQNNISPGDMSDLHHTGSSYLGEGGVTDNRTPTSRADSTALHPSTRAVDAPPAYEDVAVASPSAPLPPSYKDLFPSKN